MRSVRIRSISTLHFYLLGWYRCSLWMKALGGGVVAQEIPHFMEDIDADSQWLQDSSSSSSELSAQDLEISTEIPPPMDESSTTSTASTTQVTTKTAMSRASPSPVTAKSQQLSNDASPESQPRMWGSNTSHDQSSQSTTLSSESNRDQDDVQTTTTNSSNNDNINNNKHGSFLPHSATSSLFPRDKQQHLPRKPRARLPSSLSSAPFHPPPKGFRITSRIYTDPNDKVAYFDNDFYQTVYLPFQEYTVEGSQTKPIPVHHVTIRNLLYPGTEPCTFSSIVDENDYDSDDHTQTNSRRPGRRRPPRPQLIVPLCNDLEIVLNSGQVQTFQAGDVILMEDVICVGHKLRRKKQQSQQAQSSHEESNVLVISLDQVYLDVGIERSSMEQMLLDQNYDNEDENSSEIVNTVPDEEGTSTGNSNGNTRMTHSPTRPISPLKRIGKKDVNLAQRLFVGTGIVTFTALGVYLGVMSTIQVVASIGIFCIGFAGAFAFFTMSDYMSDTWKLLVQQHRLQQPSSTKPATTTTTMATSTMKRSSPKKDWGMANTDISHDMEPTTTTSTESTTSSSTNTEVLTNSSLSS